MKKIFAALSIALLSTSAFAQSGTNSPYSQFGLGVLSDQGNSLNRGMNGVGLALRPHNQVNYLNPASYSSIDSLSFIFDAGLSLQITNFKENGASKNAKNANFEYVVGGFRVARNLGVAFGIIPITNVGYDYSYAGAVSREDPTATTIYTNTYSGSGGIHQFFLGVGFSPIKGLSLGVNGGYLWGDIERSISNSYTDMYVGNLTKKRECSIANYKLDFGLQYEHQLNGKDRFAIGATYGVGHSLKADPTMYMINYSSQTNISDTTKYVAYDGIDLPTQISAGLSYSHGTKWTVGVDYSLQQWAKARFPMEKNVNGKTSYVPSSDLYQDRHKINAGLEYCQNTEGRSFGSRIRYRVGASYATPHLKINGLDGPSEISVSAGVGIPIMNAINNRSILNVSAQWVRSDAKNLITENTFRINLGFTFNERWFAKWKFD